jgi:serine/threonine protein kinase
MQECQILIEAISSFQDFVEEPETTAQNFINWIAHVESWIKASGVNEQITIWCNAKDNVEFTPDELSLPCQMQQMKATLFGICQAPREMFEELLQSISLFEDFYEDPDTTAENFMRWIVAVGYALEAAGLPEQLQIWEEAKSNVNFSSYEISFGVQMQQMKAILAKIGEQWKRSDERISESDAKKVISQYVKSKPAISGPFGDVKIHGQIGEGGNALVYSALREGSNKEVAVKILAENYVVDDISKRVHRFLAEIYETQNLVDTGKIASIYQSGLLDTGKGQFPFVIMKKYSHTLKSWILENPVPTIRELQPILEQLLTCLDLIHSNSIVHRDLKPENIFVNDNGTIVFGDFGIAWFDPKTHERLHETGRKERLANYYFSAPEQSDREQEVKPHPSMDIFALGQIIQWLVTGKTHRGTGRERLATVDKSFGTIDMLVEELLSQDPNKRPQSVGEVRSRLTELNQNSRLEERANTLFRCLVEFDQKLRSTFPGEFGFFHVADKDDVDRLFLMLSDGNKPSGLYYTRGMESAKINEIRRIDDETWLIWGRECRIANLWIYKHANFQNNFILIETFPMPKFFDASPDGSVDEAALFQDHYIRRRDYDDGYVKINDNVIKIDDSAEARIRDTIRQFMFIATEASNIYYYHNVDIVEKVYKNLLESDEVTKEIINPLLAMKGNPEVLMLL